MPLDTLPATSRHPGREAARQLDEVAFARWRASGPGPMCPQRRAAYCEAYTRLAIARHLLVRRAANLLPKDAAQ